MTDYLGPFALGPNDTPENGIYAGDALEMFASIPSDSIDAVITDPPFALVGGSNAGRTSLVDDQFFFHWFTYPAKAMCRILKPTRAAFIWCDWRSEAAIVKNIGNAGVMYDPWWVSQVIYHDREMLGMGSPFRNQVERIVFARSKRFKDRFIGRSVPNIIRSYWYYGKHKWHPAEKSSIVTEQLVRWITAENEIVFDPFTGGGTVPAVCKVLGRRYLAFEIDPERAELARERVRNTQLPLPGLIMTQEEITL